MFVSEEFLDMWIKRWYILRPTVALANKMDKYKDETSLSSNKLILNGKAYGVKQSV